MHLSPRASVVSARPTSSARSAPWATLLAFLPELCILTIAALTRFWRLGYHSVWFDEAVSLRWATQSEWRYMWRTTFQLVEEKHPPVYYTLLRLWHELLTPLGLGQNDAALRALGSLLGVLTVLGALLLVRCVSGRVTALVAALLVALSPLLVWYSQELRMFQPAATGIVWAGYFLAAAWQAEGFHQRVWRWLGFIVCMELALYSYLFSAFMLPAAGLTLLALLLFEPQMDADGRRWFGMQRISRAAWRRFAEGAVALFVTGLIFLPLAQNAWGVNASESTPGTAFADFPANTRKLLKVFTIWKEDWPGVVTDGALWLFGVLLLIGLVLPPKETDNPLEQKGAAAGLDRIWLVIWIGVPFLVANVLLSRSGSIFSEDRYLLFMAPFVLWAVARGVVALGARWRIAGWTTGIAVVALLAVSLPRLWTPDMFRENWRAAAHYIDQYQQQSPGLRAGAVAHINYTHQALEWYVRASASGPELPVWGLFGDPLTPDQVEDVIAPPLRGIVEWGAHTLWLTQSHLEGVDDARLVQGWLDANFPLITEQYPAGVQLNGYALQSRYAALPDLSAQAVYPHAELAPGLTLAACEVITPRVRATDVELHPPSGWVHVRLWWQATENIEADYAVTARVLGPDGVWGKRIERGTSEALRHYPTSDWSVDDFMRDEHDINLNPITPAGTYRVVIGLQDGAGTPQPAAADCGGVQIGP